jgi:serine/threonine-protein kinase
MSAQTVGRYEIVDELGRGAMGVVYRAKDPTIGRTVALKTLRLDVHGLDAGEMVRRFQNEARAAGLLNHPNIVTIYDAGEQDGIFYIAMELIEGTTLHELLHGKRILAADEVVHLAYEICKGLDYAHSHGIVHRDVKPANIMITPRGAVKIMDFGIAKAGGSMTSTGQVLGTPNYMSPEQVKGRPLDGRSDIFSLGVILYEALTGEKPFSGQNVTTIIYKIVNESPIPPRELDVTIHPGLSNAVTKALAKSPDERYQSAAELGQDLEDYKQLGATQPTTTQLSAVLPASPQEKTLVLPMRLVSGSTVRAPAAAERSPAKGPVPFRQPAGAPRSSKKSGLVTMLLIILVLGFAAGGYAFYRTRMKMQQLEAEIKQDEASDPKLQAAPPLNPAPSPALFPAATPEATASPATTASPVPAATPGDKQIAGDTTVKLSPDDESLEDKSPFKPKKATPKPVPVLLSELTFASQPDGAKVEVDGQTDINWVTPFKASQLIPGTHNVVFSKDGYLPQTRSIDSVPGKSVPVSAVLVQAANVTVTSNPSGANIWIDGNDSGQVTPAKLSLEKGLHSVSVRKAGYREALLETNLAPGKPATFAPVLLSLNQTHDDAPKGGLLARFLGSDSIPDGKGLVHFRTVPAGATIVIDGRVAPQKTNARWPADPGIYSIDLQMSGYKTVHRNIQVKQGKVTPIDEILEKQ